MWRNIPAFEKYQVDENVGEAANEDWRKNPEHQPPSRGGPSVISLLHMVVRIHQVLVQAGGDEIWISGDLLRLQLLDAGFQIGILGQQCLVARGIHVRTVMISPERPLIDRLVEQPPPEKAAVRIVIDDHGPRIVGLEKCPDANSTC